MGWLERVGSVGSVGSVEGVEGIRGQGRFRKGKEIRKGGARG